MTKFDWVLVTSTHSHAANVTSYDINYTGNDLIPFFKQRLNSQHMYTITEQSIIEQRITSDHLEKNEKRLNSQQITYTITEQSMNHI